MINMDLEDKEHKKSTYNNTNVRIDGEFVSMIRFADGIVVIAEI